MLRLFPNSSLDDDPDAEQRRKGLIAPPAGTPARAVNLPSAPETGSLGDLESKAAQPRTAPSLAAQPDELGQRRSRDEARLKTAQEAGSGISRLPTAARIPLHILETIGGAISPAMTSMIPGTTLHHNAEIGGIRRSIGQDIGEQEKEAQIGEAGARSEQAEAAAEKDRAAAAEAGKPKPKEESWKDFPQFTDTDGTPLKIEGNSGQVLRVDGKPPAGFKAAKAEAGPKTREITRVINGVPHTVMVNAETGEDVRDEGQTKIPGESPETKRNAAESAQVERESRQAIRKAADQYRGTQQSVNQLMASIDQAKDGNGLLTSFVPTMEVLGINASNGVHRISPAEAQAAGMPGGWAERFNAWFDKASTGKLSPELQQEGKALGKILADSAYQRYKSIYEDESGIVSGYGGTDFGKRVPMIPAEGGGGGTQEPPRPANVPPDFVYQKNGPKGEGWYRP